MTFAHRIMQQAHAYEAIAGKKPKFLVLSIERNQLLLTEMGFPLERFEALETLYGMIVVVQKWNYGEGKVDWAFGD